MVRMKDGTIIKEGEKVEIEHDDGFETVFFGGLNQDLREEETFIVKNKHGDIFPVKSIYYNDKLHG